MSAPARVAATPESVMRRLTTILVAVVALAAMASSLRNGFAYDDGWIIVANRPLHTLHAWWTLFDRSYWPPDFGARLYRPLTSIAFAIQWALGGGSALPFHVVNVVLYVAVCASVLALLRRTDTRASHVGGAVLAAALFAAHPIHVEAVANVVGQAELWVALLLTLCVTAYVRWRREGLLSRGRIAALLAAYLVVCLVKENGVVLPALVALAEWLLVANDERPVRKRIATLRELVLMMALVAAVTLFVRHRVLGSVSGDDPHPAFIGMANGARQLAMLALVPRVAGLFLWPARLLADYSPGDTPLRTALGAWHLAGAAIVLALLALAAFCRTRRPAVTFGILWMVVALGPVANVFVPTGIVLAERALFLPSVGFAIAVGALLAWAAESLPTIAARRAGMVAVAALVLLGVVRSALHAPVWKDNPTLFAQLLHDAPLNGRAHYSFGGMLFDRGDWDGGVREWHRAIELLPSNSDVPVALAQKYMDRGRPLEAMTVLEAEIRRRPTVPLPRLMHIAAQLRMARFTDAKREAVDGAKVSKSPIAFQYMAMVADSILIRSPNGDSIGMRPRPNGR
jgi:protein O-mannosyl-transferase